MSDGMDISRLLQLQQKPAPYEPGELQFWTDPHIASQMLLAHLDPQLDAASRRPESIARSVEWISTAFGLQPGDKILDLGCGPGLYASQLAQRGFDVTGVDFSQNSINYAVNDAREKGLSIRYRCQNYLDLDEPGVYAAVLLIYGDFCPLSPARRARLLGNISRALAPGGYFIFDVSTPNLHRRQDARSGWYAADGGFWRPGPHVVLEQGFAYAGDLFLDQYIVMEQSGRTAVYRNWFQDYTPVGISAELEQNSFVLSGFWGDLAGTAWNESSEWIGLAAKTR